MTRRKLFWRMVIASIVRRRSRVIVAMLAVAIGATTLSALATIAIDVPRQMAREMRSYGANLVMLPAGDGTSFDVDTMERAKGAIPADQLVGAVGLTYEPILINELPYVAAGTDLKAAHEINPYWYVDGEWPQGASQVFVGREIADAIQANVGDRITVTLLSGDVATGQGNAVPTPPGENPIAPADKTLDDAAPGGGAELKQLDVTISGILETGGSEDGFVYMWTEDMGKLLGSEPQLNVGEFSVAANEETLGQLATAMSGDTVTTEPVARLAHSDANVLDMLRSLMAIITVIVLALIMIGVSTTMMAVVTERRTEIGLRKALGADNRSIVSEFLGEGLMLGLVGGIAGAIAGFGLAQLISLNVFHRTVALHPLVAIGTVLASMAVSTLASLIPVRRAVDVDPALVLRGE